MNTINRTTTTSIPVDPLISLLSQIQLNLGLYVYPFIFILGNIGTFLNVWILTQPIYLKNSCSCYILASSLMNVIIINLIVLFHMLSLGFGIDPTRTSTFFCPFRQYISHAISLLSRFYIVLACVDRWAMSSTNAKYRAFSHIKVAKIIIPTLGIVYSLVSIHILWYYHIVNGRCVATVTSYSIFYNIYNTMLSGLLTPIFMTIFGFLTIRNIQRVRQRVNVQTVGRQVALRQGQSGVTGRSREYQILRMILIQLAVYVITCAPFPAYLMYAAVTLQSTKSPVESALERFFSVIAYMFTNINFSATFYIYVLTARIFRKDLKRLICRQFF